MANTTTFSFTKEGDVLNQQHLIAQVLREALPYIDFLKEKTLVIKLGGSTLEHQRSIIQDIIWLQSLGAHPVLVHGGGHSTKEIPINHRPRVAGVSKYGVFNRLGRGIYDLIAIAWYQRRRVHRQQISEE